MGLGVRKGQENVASPPLHKDIMAACPERWRDE
jgi:hypothetical protein